MPLFSLRWSVFHVIDDSSPLFGKDLVALQASMMDIYVTITALDLVFGGSIRARRKIFAQRFNLLT